MFPFLYIRCLNVDQFTMELAGTESGHIPKCYSMDMSQDFIPMSVFSESSQGKYKYSRDGLFILKFNGH